MQPSDHPGLLDRLRAGDSAVLAPAIASVLAASAADARARAASPAAAELAAALGAEAAHAGLTPDDLFVILDDAVRHELVDGAPADGPAGDDGLHSARALGAADAVVLLLWGAARRRYHDTCAALASQARRRARGSSDVRPAA
jgi:hypothetical protein